MDAELFYSDTVESSAHSAVEDAVDRGAIAPADAHDAALMLSREVRALHLSGADGDALLRDVMAPAEGDRGRAVGQINRALHEQYGVKAADLLRDALAWVGQRAPGIAASLPSSAAALSPAHAKALVGAYLRSK